MAGGYFGGLLLRASDLELETLVVVVALNHQVARDCFVVVVGNHSVVNLTFVWLCAFWELCTPVIVTVCVIVKLESIWGWRGCRAGCSNLENISWCLRLIDWLSLSLSLLLCVLHYYSYCSSYLLGLVVCASLVDHT